MQAGGSTKFNRDPYLHKIIHTSELFSLERKKEKELEALSLPQLTSLAKEWSSWCLPLPPPSLQSARRNEESGEDHCWCRKGKVRLEAPAENPCKSKDKSKEVWDSGFEGHRGHAVDAGQHSMSPSTHTSVPAPKPWGNTFMLQCLSQVAAFVCLGKWSNFVLY